MKINIVLALSLALCSVACAPPEAMPEVRSPGPSSLDQAAKVEEKVSEAAPEPSQPTANLHMPDVKLDSLSLPSCASIDANAHPDLSSRCYRLVATIKDLASGGTQMTERVAGSMLDDLKEELNKLHN